MEEGTADGRQCDGDGGREGSEAKPDVSHAMAEDANSQRIQTDGMREDAGASSCDTVGLLGDAASKGMKERINSGIAPGEDDQIESSLVSDFGAQDPARRSSSQPESEADVEGNSNHLFTDAMKLQLRAQILVLGDFLKGIAPSPDWLEEACLEPAIGVESVLLEPMDSPCDVPVESNLQRTSSAFENAGATISFSWVGRSTHHHGCRKTIKSRRTLVKWKRFFS